MSELRIHYTKLGEAFAKKVGRAAFEEVARGEIGELLTGGLGRLSDLFFHNIEFGGTWFHMVPDGDDGILVDAAVEHSRFKGHSGRELTMMSGASLDDDDHEATLERARKFWGGSG